MEEVAENFLKTFEVIVVQLPSDGWQFGRPVLEKGGDLFDRGHARYVS